MFQFSGKLDHILEPRHYYDPDWFELEQARLFPNAWQPVCAAQVVANPGDRFACEVVGRPIVVVNDQGSLKAFSNVCGHRHSLICKPGESRGERMRCQIHGWEYDAEGCLAKIPDGKHFKVVKPGDFTLSSFRVERCGPMVLVNLSPSGPSFEEHLGALAEEFHRRYDDVHLIDVWINEHDVNWKIPVENAVESYHVPMVHPGTFEDFRDEQWHDHRLEPTYTRYGDTLPYEKKPGLVSMAFRSYTYWVVKNPTYERFVHAHVFPNLMLYFGDVYSGMSFIEPIGPERTRFTHWSFAPNTVSFGWLGRRAQDLAMTVFVRQFRKILGEDMALWPPVQRGLKSSRHRGVLSAREERVHVFQRWLIEQVGTR